MNVKTNYILHLNQVYKALVIDGRITPFHISLYLALFQSWNQTKFSNPISICREEMMTASKIGSANTYTKCLKELDYWGYIKYYPSHNYQLGSKVYLYTFDKTTDNTNDQTFIMAVRPSINNTKQVENNSNNIKGDQQPKNNNSIFPLNNNSDEKEKSSGKKERVRNPTAQEVKDHFAQKRWLPIEAEKFFNHYESNGWLIGGRSPMKNWKAAADNWILNSNKFNNVKSNSKANNLHATTEKNYNEPL
ncbi:MAG: transcriptional regulator [Bacteroidia bacterium]